jgi:hypothetical protein
MNRSGAYAEYITFPVSSLHAFSGISFEEGATCQVRVLIPLLNKYSPSFFKVYENDAEQYFLALAEVAWIRPAGGRYLVGFRFVNVDENQSHALEKLIAKAFAAERS